MRRHEPPAFRPRLRGTVLGVDATASSPASRPSEEGSHLLRPAPRPSPRQGGRKVEIARLAAASPVASAGGQSPRGLDDVLVPFRARLLGESPGLREPVINEMLHSVTSSSTLDRSGGGTCDPPSSRPKARTRERSNSGMERRVETARFRDEVDLSGDPRVGRRSDRTRRETGRPETDATTEVTRRPSAPDAKRRA